MPRKPKDELRIENEVIEIKEELVKKSKAKSTKNSKSSGSKSEAVKTTRSKSSSGKVNNKSSDKADVKSTSSKTTKKATKNDVNNTSVKDSKTTKKVVSEKKSAKKSNSKTISNKSSKAVVTSVEYYDLPYRYNETVVKILAQTPNVLFIYWDISDTDRKSYIDKYGNDFFDKTKPILVVRNKTMDYTFEVEINDFANSWYLHVADANCDYSIELGRRPISYDSDIDDYIWVTTSNDMEMPNNHILFDKLGKSVFFRNIKNNFIEEREISSISFIRNFGRVYDIYELYKEMYKDEINEELNSTLKLNLSSSSSSTFM